MKSADDRSTESKGRSSVASCVKLDWKPSLIQLRQDIAFPNLSFPAISAFISRCSANTP
jgi:hypothetical protein